MSEKAHVYDVPTTPIVPPVNPHTGPKVPPVNPHTGPKVPPVNPYTGPKVPPFSPHTAPIVPPGNSPTPIEFHLKNLEDTQKKFRVLNHYFKGELRALRGLIRNRRD